MTSFVRYGVAASIVVRPCEDGLQVGARPAHAAELLKCWKGCHLVHFTCGRFSAYRGKTTRQESHHIIGNDDQGGRWVRQWGRHGNSGQIAHTS